MHTIAAHGMFDLGIKRLYPQFEDERIALAQVWRADQGVNELRWLTKNPTTGDLTLWRKYEQ